MPESRPRPPPSGFSVFSVSSCFCYIFWQAFQRRFKVWPPSGTCPSYAVAFAVNLRLFLVVDILNKVLKAT
jgi:hypothetical protein